MKRNANKNKVLDNFFKNTVLLTKAASALTEKMFIQNGIDRQVGLRAGISMFRMGLRGRRTIRLARTPEEQELLIEAISKNKNFQDFLAV